MRDLLNFKALVGLKHIFTGFIEQVDSHFFQLNRRVKELCDGFTVVSPRGSSVGRIVVVKKSVACFEGEVSVVIHVKKAL